MMLMYVNVANDLDYYFFFLLHYYSINRSSINLINNNNNNNKIITMIFTHARTSPLLTLLHHHHAATHAGAVVDTHAHIYFATHAVGCTGTKQILKRKPPQQYIKQHGLFPEQPTQVNLPTVQAVPVGVEAQGNVPCT